MKNLYVTSPLLPDLEEFKHCIDEIWESRQVTNNGTFLQEFERRLCEYLGVEHISVFTNGTIPLIASLKVLGISGEVITTPYSFVASSSVLALCGIDPVFVDVDEHGNIDPCKIEDAVTERTSAILGVHVYGNPCQTDKIREMADKHNLKVVYDAAHAFGVMKNGRSILLEGDVSTLSFHATKVFSTIEGGAVVCHSKEMKEKFDSFRNFGIEDEETVSMIGLNGKMDEIRASYGLLNLKQVDKAMSERKTVVEYYRSNIAVDGIEFFRDIENVRHNYSYFPIFVGDKCPNVRNELHERLKSHGIYSRKYFYPLITDFEAFSRYRHNDLTMARRLSDSVLCLPLFAGMTCDDAEKVVRCIK